MRVVVQDAPVAARDWLMLGALSFLWGGSFFFYKLLAPVLPPFTLVLGRVGIAALALNLALLAGRDRLRLTLPLVGWFLLLGALNSALPFCLFAWSEQRLTSGMAALLNAPTPIVTALVAHVWTHDERMSVRTVLGAMFGVAGVAVLIGPDLVSGRGSADLLPALACIVATIAYGFGGVLSRRVHGVSPLQFATGQMTGGTLVILPVAAIGDRFWNLAPIPAYGWAGLLGIGLLSTALAYLLYFRILESAGATRAALVTFLVPVTALLLGSLFLGERMALRDLPAVLLIGVGLALIDGRLLRLFRRARSAPAP